jgi:hypothetical protein
MNSMYAKLFSRIAQSSLMEQNVETRYVFMMLLAIADNTGDVIGTDVAIARTLNIPKESFDKAIAALMSPDPDSNSEEEEGRRVVASDAGRGYRIVNYVKYREIKTTEEKREYMREYMRKRRNALKSSDVTDVKSGKKPLTDVTQGEGEGELEVPPSPHTPPARTREAAPTEEQEFWPDPREYPTVQTVKQWAEQVMVSPACAEKWHATRVSENWETRNNRPLQLDSLPALFRTYATAWKAREAADAKKTGYSNGNRNAPKALQRDITKNLTADEIGTF